ncbi:AP-3 complex subunit sigma-2 [Oopsacas minuta]|uniref:AP-3 complex subunit sigma-2 n=1 Tax=Oopsacas minuta TaxID=111878 RepID=A0AAV7K3U7_9METZ|nr:AP-3 complex subunit sigma-2 [Oopsacas minuta]
MIKAILVFNNFGKPRFLKFFEYFTCAEQQQIIRETYHLVSKRDDSLCNFLEGGSLTSGGDWKIVYRHYATLYFVFCVDSSESELGILDLIQVFVETLDKCFENVCELDLIFHMERVHHVIDEIVVGGLVLETNQTGILSQLHVQTKIEKSNQTATGLVKGHINSAPNRAFVAAQSLKNTDIAAISKKISTPSNFSLRGIKF